MFLSEQQELDFYRTLTAYEEEFGSDKLVIWVPSTWLDTADMLMFIHLEIRIWNLSAIGIRIKSATAKYTMLLTEDENA